MEDSSQNPEKMFTFFRGYVTGGKLKQSMIALTYARKKHHSQFRDSDSEPYIAHPLRMACYLINLDLTYFNKDVLIAATLLHDVCEDCAVKPEELPVSKEVQKIVKYLTIEPLDGEEKSETKKRYFSEMLECPEALVIKGADRIDNLSTMSQLGVERLRKNVFETKQYLLPFFREAKELYLIYANAFQHIKNELKRLVMVLEPFLETNN